ncbi:UMP kinase [candidate division KSB1 bacterium]|nr:MAG: UMP kinase [candidate division KSB1 bacterium]
MKSSPQLKYKRILLKLSGESLAGDAGTGIAASQLQYFMQEVKMLHDLGVQMGIVIGAGNIFRGLTSYEVNVDRVTADQMGMLGTVINALALRSIFEQNGIASQVFSAFNIGAIVDSYSPHKALKAMQEGRVVILGGGTGNPFFTTDTAGVLRAVELQADVILKGTRVDGVYNADPEKVEDAIKFDELTYMEVVRRGLKVMDTTAITLAMENQLPIIVFNFNVSGNLHKIVFGESVGTKVQG